MSRPIQTLKNREVTLRVDAAGGAFGTFQFNDSKLNPLDWATPEPSLTRPVGYGHFLCLDRWGPPSESEGKNGMPYHGESASVLWNVDHPATQNGSMIECRMSARLPIAGLEISRQILLPESGSFAWVTETVKNSNRLGRIYNWVQHPSIGGKFLDRNTLVDCNGRKGFAQGGAMPQPEEPSSYWPRAFDQNGASKDLRRLNDDPHPNVTSFTIDQPIGWVTAINPENGLLIGYVWRTADYPWVSLWRDVRDGKPHARGLEFGTTGLHYPFPILAEKHQIFGRPLYEYLDASESRTKSFGMFLLKIPADFQAVGEIRIEGTRLILQERTDKTPRRIETTIPENAATVLVK